MTKSFQHTTLHWGPPTIFYTQGPKVGLKFSESVPHCENFIKFFFKSVFSGNIYCSIVRGSYDCCDSVFVV